MIVIGVIRMMEMRGCGYMEGLLTKLSELSHRNDELMTAKDSDLAKTELRSVKG